VAGIFIVMKIGTYVKQQIFDNVYRYGIIIDNGHPWFGDSDTISWTQVAFTPRADHPVATLPYSEYVKASELEVISG